MANFLGVIPDVADELGVFGVGLFIGN